MDRVRTVAIGAATISLVACLWCIVRRRTPEQHPRTPLTPEEVKAFCNQCSWAREVWQLRKYLFDENPHLDVLRVPRHEVFFVRWLLVLQEYWMLQVAKLHDFARAPQGRANLTIDYVMKHGKWDAGTRRQLATFSRQMHPLASALRVPRNRIISHSDRETAVTNVELGAFKAGQDVRHFEALEAFADLVHERVVGGPYAWDNFAQSDVAFFMSDFLRGQLGRRQRLPSDEA